MNTHARRWLAAAAIAAAALTLGACDGDSQDPPTDPATTESTTAPTDDVTTDPSPTATPPEVEEPTAPPEMLVDDATGAAAATWYFFEQYDYARATGQTAAFESMADEECTWCASVVEQIRTTAEPPDAAQALLDWRAAGATNEVELDVTAEVDHEFQPDAPGTGDDTATDGESEADRYVDLSVVGPETVTCDADGGCPQAIEDLAEEEEVTPAEIDALILQAFQSLPVESSPITYQPKGDWAALTMDFIVYTDTAEQVLGITILDIP